MADPLQPRQEFDDEGLARLADSLKSRGLLQPLRVRWSDEDAKYIIVVGERRFRAATLAGFTEVECTVVSKDQTPDEIYEDQLVENCLREDLKPTELAKAYQSVISRYGLSQRELADRLAISQSSVAQTLAILNLAPSVRESVDDGEISPAAAYQIAKLPDRKEQAEVADRVRTSKITATDLRRTLSTRRTQTFEFRGAGGVAIVRLKDGAGGRDAALAFLRQILEEASAKAAS